MVVRRELDLSKVDPYGALTEEEAAMFAEAESRPAVYDEDSPSLTEEMAAAFREARRRKPYRDRNPMRTA